MSEQESKVRSCCFIHGEHGEGNDCTKPATWMLIFGCGSDDYTDSCDEHIAELIDDKKKTIELCRIE